MMRTFALAATAATLLLCGQARASLYGVATFSNFGVQSLYTIDAATGAATLVGSTGLRQIAGINFDTSTARLVALTVAGDIYELNITTGASTLVRDGNFGVPEGSVSVEGGTTYTTISDNLHTLGATNWQQVGPSGLAAGSDISGLDFGNGQLLGLALNGTGPDQIVSFNVGTGAASVLGPTGTNASTVADLTYAFLGNQWYMTDGSALYTLNSSTGAASLIGAHGVSGFSGLAFVPAPGAAALLGMGLVVAGRRRR